MLFFAASTHGFGIKYNVYGQHDYDLYTQFIGPAYSWRQTSNSSRNAIYMNGSFGYLHRGTKPSFSNIPYNTSGLGGSIDVGADFLVTSQFAIGAQVSVFTGKIGFGYFTRASVSIGLRLLN